jgi:hypothetical protein
MDHEQPQRRFFFIHVMKTAGGTLRRHIEANFERDEVYPCERLDPNMLEANMTLSYLLGLPESRRERIKVFTGHFPYVAVELLRLRAELTTITVLRDPVERTLSYLRQWKRLNDTPYSIEEIYEHPLLFQSFIRDHQAKLFALTAEDEPESCMAVLDVDRDRLELAKRNLERVDVIATQDRFDQLLAELERRFGWRRGALERWNVGAASPDDAPTSFRRRIAEDNAADMEFFEHAERLCDLRRAVDRC